MGDNECSCGMINDGMIKESNKVFREKKYEMLFPADVSVCFFTEVC